MFGQDGFPNLRRFAQRRSSWLHNSCMSAFVMEHADVTGRIAELWIYPIKSCAGVQVQEARLVATGLEWDRAWMVVDAHGQFLTQRELPQMALIRPTLDMAAQQLHVQAPGMPTLTLPLELPLLQPMSQRRVQVWRSEVMAWDMGEAATQWFSQVLGQTCHLVRFDPAQKRYSNTKWTAGIQAPNQFADGYPLLVITDSAVVALNQRLQAQGVQPVTGLRFRANVVLGDLQDHEEDYIETLWIESGADAPAALHLGKPCSRCPIPNIDPVTAQSSPEVMATLSQYRQDARLDGSITFGMNACIAQGQGHVLRVGQLVGGQLKFEA